MTVLHYWAYTLAVFEPRRLFNGGVYATLSILYNNYADDLSVTSMHARMYLCLCLSGIFTALLLHHAQPNYRITSRNVTKEDWTSTMCTIIALHDMISIKEVKYDCITSNKLLYTIEFVNVHFCTITYRTCAHVVLVPV